MIALGRTHTGFPPPDASPETLFDAVQRQTLRYFWDFAHPISGLALDRSNNRRPNVVATGGSGFGIMAILVGVERGWIGYDDALDRLLTMAHFLSGAERYHGAFPHWMDGNNGRTIPFSSRDNGGDLVETSFLIAGLLSARQYFRGAHVKIFTAFLGRSPDTATPEDLRRFQLHLTGTGVRPPTINGTVTALRFFFTVTLLNMLR